jgi:hypothetical protein
MQKNNNLTFTQELDVGKQVSMWFKKCLYVNK